MLVAAKGATSGYWPFGFVAASDEVHGAVMGSGGFTHGFTYSHAPAGAAVALEVLRILEDENLVEASATKGRRLRELLDGRLGDHPNVGEVRGRGLLVGVELVADRSTRAAFPRAARLTEAIVRGARSRGVLLYSGTGTADGINGDTILLGPPFVITDDELTRVVAVVGEAIDEGVATVQSSPAVEGVSHRDAVAGSTAGA
jgi:adenosylmethionine-8-amino-7-oxononanoate aminotransferase